MYLFYSLLIYIFLPVVVLRLWWRGRFNPNYRQRIGERFGFIKTAIQPGPYIWIHAVSVGEAVAAVPLIQAILMRWPNKRILVTTTTPTGSQRVRELLGDIVSHVYLPYDYPDVLVRFFRYVKPNILILMETELWPNLLLSCRRNKVPVFIANARLSPRSAEGYKRVAWMMKKMIDAISFVAAQTTLDACRFLTIGVPSEKIAVAGNLKFAITPSTESLRLAKEIRSHWGVTRLVWVAASTHEGEENVLLTAHQQLLLQFPEALLILVPRHPERFDKVAKAAQNLGLISVRRSLNQAPTENTQVFIGDTMGELMSWYAASDIAFVGGSLVPIGGHNLLEPAALGLPVIIGQYFFNFTAIKEQLEKIGVLYQIDDCQNLIKCISCLWQDKSQRQKISLKAKEFIQSEQYQSVNKHMELLKGYINE